MWGYLVESAQVTSTRKIFVLMQTIEARARATVLWWMPMEQVYTKKQALLLYKAEDTDRPAEDVVCEILKLLQEVFECALEDKWSYTKRSEFYRAFPFEKLRTKEEVVTYRPVLFSCPVFSGPELQIPESE